MNNIYNTLFDIRRYSVLCLFFILAIPEAQSQDWELIWADEFNGSISNDWIFETGTGSGGWGNNELQYYRQQNASVENGQLVITARREGFGGSAYTSARMKTQGRMSVTYGRIEARLSVPMGSGLWPAFWMLGESISSVSWPHCGEIDVMEHINSETTTYGTIHWQDHNDTYAYFTGSISLNPEDFHVYAIEWDPNAIRWYLDGTLYHEADISDGLNGTQEFHDDFFLLLNLAVGGNWPGFEIDESSLPAQYRIDYVRVYQDANGSGSSSSGGNNSSSSSGGGNNSLFGLEAIDSDSILFYVNINSGFADLHYRLNGGPQLNYAMENSNGRKEFTVNNLSNGDVISYWLTYQNPDNGLAVDTSEYTYTHEQGSNSGSGGSSSSGSGSSTSGATFNLSIEAENYSAMNGVQTENTSDSGGGQNVGWIDNGDWMAYGGITVPNSGTYTIEYRVASINGGQLSQDLNAGSSVLGTVTIPATGGWQNWTTVSQTVELQQGTYDFGIFASTGGWNINWWRISSSEN